MALGNRPVQGHGDVGQALGRPSPPNSLRAVLSKAELRAILPRTPASFPMSSPSLRDDTNPRELGDGHRVQKNDA